MLPETEQQAPLASPVAPPESAAQPMLSDAQLCDKFKQWHKESFDKRYVFERQWLRNLWYLLGRQWIYFDSKRGQWQDKRMAKNFPRPTTSIPKEIINTVRANFTAINYGAMARPIGNETKNIITAGVADDYIPVLHDDHDMDNVLNEFDFWMLVTGNAFLHTAVTYERKNGVINVQFEQCTACGQEYDSGAIADADQACPGCGAPAAEVMQPTRSEERPKPKGVTVPLSPFEIAFPLIYERFDLTPYVIRMRWRDKVYYETHPEPQIQLLAKTLPFSKSPSDRTMQIFKTLPFQNDLGMAPSYYSAGGGQSDAEGIVEYDVWLKPSEEWPEGQVIRFAGEQSPVVIHSEMEGLPGPLPYTDAKGVPVFTFAHAEYDHIGGRSIGASILDPIISKVDTLNQIDSMMLMNLGRMANPVWLKPKGLEIPHLTEAGSTPGFVVEWDPLISNGAKPERVDGSDISQGYFTYRALLKQEIEEGTGTFDIMKGQKPAGVEAFAALNLLVERGQARHISAFKSRGGAYKDWARFALEIERAFGGETRTMAVMAPNKGWAFQTFQSADLGGDIDILLEDGTTTPKTALGDRAMVSQLGTLGLLNPADPDQIYKIYELFGATKLLPGMDAQKQEAWLNMEKIERFVSDPAAIQAAAQAAATGMPAGPIIYRRWYNPVIHRQEFINWCVSDRGRAVIEKAPQIAGFLESYLIQIDMALQMAKAGIIDAGGEMLQAQLQGKPGAGGPPKPGGAGQGMANSDQNAAGTGSQSSGAGGTAEPAQQAV